MQFNLATEAHIAFIGMVYASWNRMNQLQSRYKKRSSNASFSLTFKQIAQSKRNEIRLTAEI